jgi:DNA-binding beta-propeller fold protein YncE
MPMSIVSSRASAAISGSISKLRAVAFALFAVALLCATTAPAAQAVSRIYWSNLGGNSISWANLDGSGGGDLPIDPTTLNGPMGLAIDTTHGKIYWANYGRPPGQATGTSIGVANLDGSGAHLLLIIGIPVHAPHGVAVDASAGKLYWTNHINSPDQSWIGVSNLDGSGATFFNTSGTSLHGPRGLALDRSAGRLYWANWDGNTISYANLDGSGGHDLNLGSATVDNPEGVGVSHAQNRLYYGNFDDTGGPDPGDTISYVNLDGSGGANLQTPGATRDDPHGIAIDSTTRTIYWPNFAGDSISYARLDGSGGADLPTPGATLDGPDLPVLFKTPSFKGKLAVSGKPKPGATLSCPADWNGDDLAALLYRAPQSVGHQWLKNGRAITGATSSSLRSHGIGDYRCQETAANQVGSSTETSQRLALFRIGKAHHNRRRGTAALRVLVPDPGRLWVSGKGVRKRRTLARVASGGLSRKVHAGRVKLTIRAKGKAERRLLRRGKVRLRLRVTYRPTGGPTERQHRRLKLKERR